MSERPTDNSLYYGDCLDWMQTWSDNSVDLIYLDPPFNSNTDYNMLYSIEQAGDAQYRAFTDTWTWDDEAQDRLDMYVNAFDRPAHKAISGLYRVLGNSGMAAYLTYMAERLEQCWRLLKPTGSVFLHCDSTASHYLKVLMDGICGVEKFYTEITWKRTSAHNHRMFGSQTDSILMYGGDKRNPSAIQVPLSSSHIASKYRYKDSRGTYRLHDLTGPGTREGESGEPWQGADPTTIKRHWAVPKTGRYANYVNEQLLPGYLRIEGIHARLEALHSADMIKLSAKAGGMPQLKRYLPPGAGQVPGNLWTDIDVINSRAKERLGYPTQKPLALLERIIKASSDKGDLVLDPFCGCGTAVDAANRLGRRWAGIDISSFPIDLIKQRLGDKTIPTYGIPYDLRSAQKMAASDPFGFESWAVHQLPGFVPNTKQVGDGGVDGRGRLAVRPDNWNGRLALAQVKGGKKVPIDGLRAFCGVSRQRKAAWSCYVTVNPLKTPAAHDARRGMKTIQVAGQTYRRMNLWSIAEYFDERLPLQPTMANPYTGKPMAQRSLF